MQDKRTATRPVHLFAFAKERGRERKEGVMRLMGEGEKESKGRKGEWKKKEKEMVIYGYRYSWTQ